MRRPPKPPLLTSWLLRRMTYYEDRHSIQGDFEETFRRTAEKKSKFRARWWYRRQVMKSLSEYLRLNFYMVAVMLKNYLVIAVRNLKKSKIYSMINVIGLAVGIASCLLILIHIRYELSYDRFHENADRIYRVVLERTRPDRVRNWGWSSPQVAKTLVKDYPEVIKGIRILTETGPTQLKYKERGMIETGVLYTDPEFFEIFDIPIVEGEVSTFLKQPDTIIITREVAKKYFGSEDPMGKVLTIRNWWEEDKPHVVTGVIDDLPKNSHFHYRALVPLHATEVAEFEWGAWYTFNYILLREGANSQELEAKLPGMVNKYFPTMFEGGEAEFREWIASGQNYRYFLQPLLDIHLRSRIEHEQEPVGNIAYIYLFSLIAGFILVLACVNFINLSTSRSVSRAREVGVRKVLGSFRRQLVGQFLFESILLTLLALILACGMVAALIPAFRSLTGADLSLVKFNFALIIPGLILFAFAIGVLSGAYPAFYLSSFQPTQVLKGLRKKRITKTTIRNVLVVFQFTVSIALIVGTLFVRKQVDFMLQKDLGFDKDHVVVIENARALAKQVHAFKAELKKDPNVISAANGGYPGVATHTFSTRALGIPNAPYADIYNNGGDPDYIETLGLKIVTGNNYPQKISHDERMIILNESAVKALGLTDPIGKQLEGGQHPRTIIGVVKDFHFRSLHNDIAAYALIGFDPDEWTSSFMIVRIRPGSMAAALPQIEKVWKNFTGGLSFQYTILDETLAKWYDSEEQTGTVSAIFSGLAIMIGCLGLFGLAAFNTEQRTREVGIRKVLGASVLNIMVFFIRDFMKLVGMAFLLAVPLAYLVVKFWLRSFAYSINPDWYTFIIAGGFTILLAVLTVGMQVMRAAFANPADSLRYE